MTTEPSQTNETRNRNRSAAPDPPAHPRHSPTQATQVRPPAVCRPRVDAAVGDPSLGLQSCVGDRQSPGFGLRGLILHSPRRERLGVLTRDAMWQRDSNLCADTHDFIGHLKIIETSKAVNYGSNSWGVLCFPPTFVTDFLARHSLLTYKTMTCR